MRFPIAFASVAVALLVDSAALAQGFTDWTSIDTGSNTAHGTLGSVAVTMTGGDLQLGVADGTSIAFNEALFCPPLPISDLVEFIGTAPAHSYTITFSSPIQDPILHIRSLASTLVFSGVTLTKLCGENTFAVSGNQISGICQGGGPPPAHSDANGTVRLNGLVSSFSFTAFWAGCPGGTLDGVALQIGLSPPCQQPPSDLEAWWPGEGNTLDLMGAHHGWPENGVAFEPGIVGQAFGFDGVNDRVMIPDDTAWDFGMNDFSIAFWVNFNQIKNSMFIHQQSGTGFGGFELDYQPGSGRLIFSPNGASISLGAPWAPQTGIWYHLALTRTTGTYRLYLNGTEFAAQSDPNPIANVTGPVRIGSWAGGVGYEVAGRIDEIVIAPRALTSGEIATMAAVGVGFCPPPSPVTNLVQYQASSGVLPDEVCPRWTPIDNAPGTPTAGGGILTLSTASNSQSMGYSYESGSILFPAITVIEFRCRLVSGSSASVARAPIMVQVNTTDTRVSALLGIGTDEVFLVAGDVVRGPTANVDTDGGMHTYRIEITGAAVSVSYDGAQILTGATFSNSGADPLKAILWGEISGFATGTSQWEFFRHNASTVACGECVPPPAGLVGWWPGDGNPSDFVGPNEGSALGGAGFNSGLVGQAFSFDGVNDEIAIGHTPALNFGHGDGFTVDAWLRPVTSVLGTTRAAVYLTYVCSAEVIAVDLMPDGRAHFQIRDSNNISVDTFSPGSIVDGRWHHVAGVRNVGSQSVNLYLDGVLADSRPDLTTGTFTRSDAQDRIGSVPVACPSNRYFWAGQIDEVEVFNRALSGTEIAAIVNAGASGKCKSLPPVVVAPSDTTYPCASQVPAAAPGQATASDDAGVTSLTVAESSNGGAGSIASPLVLTRTWTATDADGHSASDSQSITVIDNVPPAIVIPTDLTATTGPGVEPCADARSVLEPGTATATDNCGTPTVTVSGLPEGSLFPVGETLIIWTATDAAGNAASDTQRVVVRCPVGDLVGTASLSCNGQTVAAANVTVRLLHEGSPFRTTTTVPAGDFRFDDVRLGTYTVDIEPPPGYGIPIDFQLVTLAANELALDPFVFTCLLGDLTGQVTGTCNGQSTGLQGVTVDLFGEGVGGMDVLVATTATNASGGYRFDDLALGDYTVSLVLPLGYGAGATGQSVTLATADATVSAPAFALTCQPIAAQPRAMGYWKHQVNVYLTGKGQAQETLAQLLDDIDLMVEHFNQNLVNPVVVYVPGAASTNDKLLQLQQLLTVNKGGTALDRAKQHLLSLLLNVVSGKISQTQAISSDGATVAQAITYSHDLITDANPVNDATAQNICEVINSGQPVPAGMVPVNTRLITYDRDLLPQSPPRPTELKLGPVVPNPAGAEATISFALPSEAPAVLEVHDLAGRLVARQDVGGRGVGIHSIRLGQLARVRAGVYLVRLTQAGVVRSLRLAVVR